MKFKNMINIIDSHTAGEPMRVITGGIPTLYGETITEKMEYMRKNYDWIRKAVMLEPRGHREMCGAVLTEPTTKDADVGVFYIDTGSYAPMCGHGILAISKILVETGMVPAVEPVTTVVMETPAGLVNAFVKVKNGEVIETTFENVPSFMYCTNLKVKVSELGTIDVDIGYGGNFFVCVDIEDLGLELKATNMTKLAKLGMKIIKSTNEIVKVAHPIHKDINYLEALLFCEEPQKEGQPYKVLSIYGSEHADRSPCGTGTATRMARLFLKGKLKVNEEFIHESPIGTQFKGKIIREEAIGKFKGVVSEITGKAFITGFNNLIISEKDPMKNGILIL